MTCTKRLSSLAFLPAICTDSGERHTACCHPVLHCAVLGARRARAILATKAAARDAARSWQRRRARAKRTGFANMEMRSVENCGLSAAHSAALHRGAAWPTLSQRGRARSGPTLPRRGRCTCARPTPRCATPPGAPPPLPPRRRRRPPSRQATPARKQAMARRRAAKYLRSSVTPHGGERAANGLPTTRRLVESSGWAPAGSA